MGVADIVLIVPIVGGAVYLLYRSLWKKKGYCTGCDSFGKSGYGCKSVARSNDGKMK